MSTKPSATAHSRLYNLFEHLVSHKSSRANKPQSLIDTATAVTEHTDILTDTILSRFRDMVELLATRSNTKKWTYTTRPRSKTLCSPHATLMPGSSRMLLVHPFTFKMMIHKLYDVYEWRDKVRTELEASQLRFKPLAETTPRPHSPVTSTHLSLNPKRETRKREACDRGSRALRRQRSSAILISDSHQKPSPSSLTTSATSPNLAERHVVKKRCTGRRKMATAIQDESLDWVYLSTASSYATSSGHHRIRKGICKRASYFSVVAPIVAPIAETPRVGNRPFTRLMYTRTKQSQVHIH